MLTYYVMYTSAPINLFTTGSRVLIRRATGYEQNLVTEEVNEALLQPLESRIDCCERIQQLQAPTVTFCSADDALVRAFITIQASQPFNVTSSSIYTARDDNVK